VNQKGFSVIEAIVALCILAIISVSVFVITTKDKSAIEQKEPSSSIEDGHEEPVPTKTSSYDLQRLLSGKCEKTSDYPDYSYGIPAENMPFTFSSNFIKQQAYYECGGESFSFGSTEYDKQNDTFTDKYIVLPLSFNEKFGVDEYMPAYIYDSYSKDGGHSGYSYFSDPGTVFFETKNYSFSIRTTHGEQVYPSTLESIDVIIRGKRHISLRNGGNISVVAELKAIPSGDASLMEVVRPYTSHLDEFGTDYLFVTQEQAAEAAIITNFFTNILTEEPSVINPSNQIGEALNTLLDILNGISEE